MIRTILVPVAGSGTDEPVLATALAATAALDAHLDFLHVRVGAGEAAPHTPHVEFARGEAVVDELSRLERRADRLAAAARRHVEDFCRTHGIPPVAQPTGRPGSSAEFREIEGDARHHLLDAARHSDLAILGRQRHRDGLSRSLVEELLLRSGRPLLIAPPEGPVRLGGTVMVCWKEAPQAARALAAALPLLERADRVVLVGVPEHEAAEPDTLDAVAHQLAWHGIRAEPRRCPSPGRATHAALADEARRLEADLLVLGGYGRGAFRELVFGGVTRAMLEAGDRPVFIMA